MWRSKKSSAAVTRCDGDDGTTTIGRRPKTDDETIISKTEDETTVVTKEEELVKDSISAMDKTAATAITSSSASSSSFLTSLWKRKSKSGRNDTSSTDDGITESTNTKVTTEFAEDPDEMTKNHDVVPRWSSLWGSNNPKGNEGEEPSNEIEVEIKKNNRIQIHEKQSSGRRSSSTTADEMNRRQTVHEEALDMLTGSLLIYCFAELRELARTGVIQSEDLLQDDQPITLRHVMHAIQTNRHALAERATKMHEDIEQRLTALQGIHCSGVSCHYSNHHSDGEGQEVPVISPTQPSTPISDMIGKLLRGGSMNSTTVSSSSTTDDLQDDVMKDSVLAYYHDEQTTQGVVYGIVVNHVRRRVTIIFRGSVTRQDFITDARSGQKQVDVPLRDILPESEIEKIRIHTGFYHYLFRQDEEGKVRLQHILQDAKQLLQTHSGYRLFVTGHSLGGACATLCGFFAAMDNEIIAATPSHQPVVVYSIASPQVGNNKFCKAFRELERRKRIQHLRIANKEDMITHLPFATLKPTAFSPLLSAFLGAGNLYSHCGVHLEFQTLDTTTTDEDEGAASAAAEKEGKKNGGDKRYKYSICHSDERISIATTTTPEEKRSYYSEKFQRSIEAAKLLVESLKPMANADFESLICHHSCREYEARLMSAKEYLSTVVLDDLYNNPSKAT